MINFFDKFTEGSVLSSFTSEDSEASIKTLVEPVKELRSFSLNLFFRITFQTNLLNFCEGIKPPLTEPLSPANRSLLL